MSEEIQNYRNLKNRVQTQDKTGHVSARSLIASFHFKTSARCSVVPRGEPELWYSKRGLRGIDLLWTSSSAPDPGTSEHSGRVRVPFLHLFKSSNPSPEAFIHCILEPT